MYVTVRPEEPRDFRRVFEVEDRAFGESEEARLVEVLRREPEVISLVAEVDGLVVGHVMFSPVTITSDQETWRAVGLNPLAVDPKVQRRGIGSALVHAGLKACRKLGELVVVVLGHRNYYPRFGFRPAATADLHYRDEGEEPSFMVMELEPDAIGGRSGWVRFLPQFDALGG